jgi:hypothetical protein
MRELFHHLIAVVCLVALMCGGQMTACACAIAPAADAVACSSHGDSHESEHHHDHSTPGADAHCPCMGCHSCAHLAMVLPAVSTPAVITNGFAAVRVETPALVSCCREVFIPPKV